MPNFEFAFNLGSLVSPLLLLVLAWLVNTARKAVDRRVDERHNETQSTLMEIRAQTTATNGKVIGLEEWRTVHEQSSGADHDVLMTLVGKVDVLLARKGDPV